MTGTRPAIGGAVSAARSEWRRSRRSVNNDCVELRTGAGRVRIRDSKNPGRILDISPRSARASWPT
ncbi:DUF397 domain-containing protein [Actinokineospora soli]|uniref:DUF397 domain-containing protein n=1 Tax=Actinokineospora soli TaxID=1048753 RepID=A0ABW2THG6_9PSEU